MTALISETTEYATPKQLAQIHQRAFSENAIRWHIFNARSNGLEPYIRRIGRKVLIDVNGFRAWIEKH